VQDIVRTVLFVLDDREWPRKVVVGAAFTCLSCFLVGIPFVLGYLLEVQRRVVRGVEPTLPEWDDLPQKFMDGLRLVGIVLLYGICFGIAWAILRWVPLVGTLLLGVLAVILSMAFLYVMVRLALTGDVKEAFKVRDIYETLRDNLVDFLAARFAVSYAVSKACVSAESTGETATT